MHDFLQLRCGLVTPIDQNCIIHHCYNSNRSHESLWKRCGQLTVHLVAVVTAPWRQGSVSWEGSDGKRWILCSCCALLSKEMSCADPNKVEGRVTPVMGSGVCPSKNTGWEKGNAGCLPPRQPHYRGERSGEQSPVESTLHLEKRDGKSTLNMCDR